MQRLTAGTKPSFGTPWTGLPQSPRLIKKSESVSRMPEVRMCELAVCVRGGGGGGGLAAKKKKM
jgi:hypothetical protein